MAKNFVKEMRIILKKLRTQKVKIVLIIFIYFVLFTTLLILTALYQTAGEKAKYIQTYIGNAVSVLPSGEYEADVVTDTVVKRLSVQEEVLDYNTFSSQGNVIFSDIKAYVPCQKNLDQLIAEKRANRKQLGVKGRDDELRINCGLYGVKNSDTSVFFLSKGFRLIEGTHLRKEDAGVPSVLISEKLADINELKVGDWFQIEVDNTYQYPVESPYNVRINGIFQCDVPENPNLWPADNPANTVIMQEETLNYCFYHMDEVTYMPGVAQLTLFLKDNAEIVPFIERMKEEESMMTFVYNEKWSGVAAKPVKDMQRLSGILSLVMSVGIFTITLLIGMFYIRSSCREIGIFLSMGMEKGRVITRLLLEEMIPIILAAVIAIICAMALIVPIGERISGDYYESSQMAAEQVRKVVGGKDEEKMEDIVMQVLEPTRLTLHIDNEVDYHICAGACMKYLCYVFLILPFGLIFQMAWILRHNSVAKLLLG